MTIDWLRPTLEGLYVAPQARRRGVAKLLVDAISEWARRRGCAELDAPLAARLKGAPLVFFDGTLFTDDEMIRMGLMQKTGARMGHMSISGDAGSIAAFKNLGVGRKVFVHINNSNPVLDDNSPERKATEASGWEVGYDGMEVRL